MPLIPCRCRVTVEDDLLAETDRNSARAKLRNFNRRKGMLSLGMDGMAGIDDCADPDPEDLSPGTGRRNG
jgi:hypothetical protein